MTVTVKTLEMVETGTVKVAAGMETPMAVGQTFGSGMLVEMAGMVYTVGMVAPGTPRPGMVSAGRVTVVPPRLIPGMLIWRSSSCCSTGWAMAVATVRRAMMAEQNILMVGVLGFMKKSVAVVVD